MLRFCLYCIIEHYYVCEYIYIYLSKYAEKRGKPRGGDSYDDEGLRRRFFYGGLIRNLLAYYVFTFHDELERLNICSSFHKKNL